MTKEEFLARLEIAKAWIEGKKVRRRPVGCGSAAWQTIRFPDLYVLIFLDDRFEFELVREPKVIWVNEYPEGDPAAHTLKENALKHALPEVVRKAVRFIEDMTNE